MSGATAERAAPPSFDADARPDHHRLVWAARDTWSVAKRNLLHFVRQPRLLMFSTIQPIMFILLFTYVFGGVAEGSLPEGLSYLQFLLPGIFVQSAVFRASFTATGLAEDLERGVIDRFRSLPMARLAVLAGRTIADFIRGIVIVLLMIAVGYIIGFRFTQGILGAIGAIVVVGVFSYALSWIFVFVALNVPGAEAAQSASFVTVFPLVFVSSIFVPIETMPGWLQAVAANSPVTATADLTRSLSVGGPVIEPLITMSAWIVGVLAVAVPASVWRYQRMT